MTTEQSDPFGASNGYTEALPLAESMDEPRPSSARPGGSDYQRLMADAMESSEFSESVSGGIPVRRQGHGLHIGYDSAMAMLGFSDGDA